MVYTADSPTCSTSPISLSVLGNQGKCAATPEKTPQEHIQPAGIQLERYQITAAIRSTLSQLTTRVNNKQKI